LLQRSGGCPALLTSHCMIEPDRRYGDRVKYQGNSGTLCADRSSYTTYQDGARRSQYKIVSRNFLILEEVWIRSLQIRETCLLHPLCSRALSLAVRHRESRRLGTLEITRGLFGSAIASCLPPYALSSSSGIEHHLYFVDIQVSAHPD
jgi:hypothetical protein